MTLNEQAMFVVEELIRNADQYRVAVHSVAGAQIIDAGISAPGGLQAGLALARICVADRADISFAPGASESLNLPMVQVHSDDPVRACLASQYAGWQIAVGKFFAMGSGPMRAHYGKEELFDHIPGRETASAVAGARISELPFPPETAATLLIRGDRLIAPKGDTVLTPGDSAEWA